MGGWGPFRGGFVGRVEPEPEGLPEEGLPGGCCLAGGGYLTALPLGGGGFFGLPGGGFFGLPEGFPLPEPEAAGGGERGGGVFLELGGGDGGGGDDDDDELVPAPSMVMPACASPGQLD
jgi:hypothetical protein